MPARLRGDATGLDLGLVTSKVPTTKDYQQRALCNTSDPYDFLRKHSVGMSCDTISRYGRIRVMVEPLLAPGFNGIHQFIHLRSRKLSNNLPDATGIDRLASFARSHRLTHCNIVIRAFICAYCAMPRRVVRKGGLPRGNSQLPCVKKAGAAKKEAGHAFPGGGIGVRDGTRAPSGPFPPTLIARNEGVNCLAVVGVVIPRPISPRRRGYKSSLIGPCQFRVVGLKTFVSALAKGGIDVPTLTVLGAVERSPRARSA
ncbi:hypothetical protein FA95DRAFT_1598387 [Auriscalpium vulgare]|uniref:Uncharacterized protein n=1 Tax=Auriscalpium vulgare TaxID=40419 RepID=A0ACB8RF02_9AGAM|nr:hypothetical protein FA95DRAFT_1598387 [Auriscalpium vulgare]